MKRKIAVILAADVAGFSKLVAEDEEETLRRLASYRSVFDGFIKAAGGRIFNTAGDSILAEFHSAVDAVRCAIDVQESLRVHNQAYPPSRQMRFRMGITMGDVVEQGGDLLGDGVNIAARLQTIAPEGGICISRSVHEAVANKLSVKFFDKGMQQLKNISEPMQAYTIGPVTDDAVAVNTKAEPPTSSAPNRGMLLFGGTATLAAALAFVALRHPDAPALPVHDKGSVAEIMPKPIVPAEVAPKPPVEVAAKPETPNPETAEVKKPTSVSEPKLVAPETPPVTVAKAEPRQIDALAANALLTRRLLDCNEAKLDKAVAPCRAVLDLNLLTGSELAAVQLRVGRALRESGDSKAAIEMLSQSINQQPTAAAYTNRGIAFYDEAAIDKSIADYTEAIRLDPKNAEAFNNRAWTRYKTGDLKTSLEDADKAVELSANQSYVWDTRGHVHEALGNRSLAVRDYRQAVALDPSNAESKSGLERLGEKK